MAELRTYTTTETQEVLHVSRRTLYNYIQTGQLKAVKIGRDWRITEAALKEFLEHGTEKNYLGKH